MKKFLRNLLFPTLLTSTFSGYGKIMMAGPIIPPIEYQIGKLEAQNYVYDIDFIKDSHYTIHDPRGKEDYGTLDRKYGAFWGPFTKKTKIVSVIPEYELLQDGRPLESFTPVNLEFSLHSQDGSAITLNSTNELRCTLSYDFSPKPITLWRRIPIIGEPYPDKYNLQFLADVREVITKNGGIVPLLNLNGEYASQDPYDFLQLRFDVYPGNLNFSLDADGKVLHGIVNMKDLAILGNDWAKQGQPLEFVGDITGAQGLPDGKVDYQDLELLTRYWLKDIRDIMPSP